MSISVEKDKFVDLHKFIQFSLFIETINPTKNFSISFKILFATFRCEFKLYTKIQ